MREYMIALMGISFVVLIVSMVMLLKSEMDIGGTKPWYKDFYVWRKVSTISGYTFLTIPTIPVLFNFFMNL